MEFRNNITNINVYGRIDEAVIHCNAYPITFRF
jgi:hypothetical protein